MDLTKILKVGDKVYCPIFGNCTVVKIKTSTKDPYPIIIESICEIGLTEFTKDGKYLIDSPECILFPSKENRDWSSFKRKKEISFKPFDKVLVRDDINSKWKCTFFSYYESGALYPFITSHSFYKYCILYNSETEHLVGTTEDCPDKYKIWE